MSEINLSIERIVITGCGDAAPDPSLLRALAQEELRRTFEHEGAFERGDALAGLASRDGSNFIAPPLPPGDASGERQLATGIARGVVHALAPPQGGR